MASKSRRKREQRRKRMKRRLRFARQCLLVSIAPALFYVWFGLMFNWRDVSIVAGLVVVSMVFLLCGLFALFKVFGLLTSGHGGHHGGDSEWRRPQHDDSWMADRWKSPDVIQNDPEQLSFPR